MAMGNFFSFFYPMNRDNCQNFKEKMTQIELLKSQKSKYGIYSIYCDKISQTEIIEILISPKKISLSLVYFFLELVPSLFGLGKPMILPRNE